MELDRYLRALLRHWYLLVIPIIVGFASAYAYFQVLGTNSATATVAVIEPAVTKVNVTQQAQLTYSSVAESYRVAERVIQKHHLDMTPKDLQGAVTVKLARSLVANLTDPLYIVSVSHRNADTAVQLTNWVMDEAKQVFFELNTIDPVLTDATFKSQEDLLRADQVDAQKQLHDLESANDAWMLPTIISGHVSLLTGLQQGIITGTSESANAAQRAQLQQALAAAQAEQARLRILEPEYDRLALDVSLATTAVGQETTRSRDLSYSADGALQANAQVQISTAKSQLDDASRALLSFQQTNRVGDLPTDMAAQAGLIGDLRRQLVTLAPDVKDPQKAIEGEKAELRRLTALLPDYETLNARISQDSAQLTLLDNRKLDLMVNGVVEPATQLKVLDTARIESQTLWVVMIHVLGMLLGLFAGLTLVYMVAYFDRTPRTTGDVEELLGFPVLARLPRAQ